MFIFYKRGDLAENDLIVIIILKKRFPWRLCYVKDLIDQVHKKIRETLNKNCGIGCNKLVYVVTDVERCLGWILQRKEESTMVELRDYLHCLQKEYDEYYRIFVEQNGSDSTEKLINIDEDKVLVRKVEGLLKIS